MRPENDFIGKIFTFGNSDGHIWGQMRFENDGMIGLYRGHNEATWKIDGEELLVLGSDGQVTTRYRQDGGRWVGSFWGSEYGKHWLEMFGRYFLR